MTIQSQTASNTPPKYLVRLESSLGNIDLTTPPKEWEEGELEMDRDIKVGGVFSTFNVQSLTFYKEGADLINRLFAASEMNAQCTMRQYYLHKTTLQYIEFPTSYSLQFPTRKVVKSGDYAIGVQINAEKSGQEVKFDLRRKIDIDITKYTTIGGFEIVPYADLAKYLKYPEINAYKKGIFSHDTPQNYAQATPGIYYVYLPQTITRSDFTEVRAVVLTETGALNKLYALYYESEEARDLVITGEIVIDINLIVGATSAVGLVMNIVNASSVSVASYVLASYSDLDSGVKTIPISQAHSISPNESIVIYAFNNVENPAGSVDFDIVSTAVTLSQTIITSPELTRETLPIYETGEQLSRHMLDAQWTFYSEYLGRLDTAYNLAGDFYPSENQLRFYNYASGLHIRGEKLSDNNSPLALSWDKWFQGATSMLHLGYTFEVIDSFLRLRVEEYAFFFDATTGLDLSDRISVFDIESEGMPELAYADIASGYKSFDYEDINGRGEYNVGSQRTSIVNTSTKFNNVSDIRGDTRGLAKALANSVHVNGSEDLKSDNDIFVTKSQRNTTDSGIDWDAETNENVVVDDETSLFNIGSLNLIITPARMLIRRGSLLKASLTKFLSSKIRFQTSDKNQTLKTTGEGYTVTENDDIVVDDLEDPIFKPFMHRVKVQLDWDDIAYLQANPYKLIKFTASLSGYLLNLKKKNNSDDAVIEIIEQYVS